MPPSSVSERIKAFHASLAPDKVFPKYSLMAASPYRFFRGTCHLFYEDLSRRKDFPHNAPPVWGCGDLHLENFGSYKAANGYVYFDQNDFDEAALLPATWELARVAASIVVAFRSLGAAEEKAVAWTRLFLAAYCKRLKTGKAKHIEARLATGIVGDFLKQAGRRKGKDLLRKLVAKSKRTWLLSASEKLSVMDGRTKKALLQCVANYLPTAPGRMLRSYKIIDACHRTAGTGSVGIKRYLLLLRRAEEEEKFLLLDMKEARPSALGPFNPVPQPVWPSEAERVVAIQSRSQYATTAQLTSLLFDGVAYTVQELQPEEDKLDFAVVAQHDKDVNRVLKDMAQLTASAQLRSSGRQGSAITDALIRFGNSAEWPAHLLHYAIDYAAQVATDYERFLTDFNNGFFDAKA